MTATALARPLAPHRPFFGWYIVILAFLGQLMSWGLFFALTYFMGPMTADLGWSSTQFSSVNLLSNISFAVAMPLLGRFIDQYGGRWFMIAGGLLGSTGVAGLAFVQELWQFYILLGILVPLAMSLYGTIVTGVALANWFHARRGRAFALASMGTSAGGITFGPLTSYLVANVGWREAWLVLSVIVLAGVALPAFLLMQRRPEDVGLRPDGEPEPAPAAVPGGVSASAAHPVWTRSAAMRTRAFWLVVLAFAMSNLVIAAFLLHIIPFLRSNGLSAGQATALATSFSAALLLCKPVYGVLLERLPARRVSLASFAFSGTAIVLLLLFRQPAMLVFATMLYAVAMGGAIPMEDVTWANYFGRWTLGQIRGAAYPLEAMLGALGPLIGGVVFDATGGYAGAFAIFALAYLISAAAIGISRPPRLGPKAAPVAAAPARPPAAAANAFPRLADLLPLGRGAARRAARYSPLIAAGLVGFALGVLVNLLPLARRRSDGASKE